MGTIKEEYEKARKENYLKYLEKAIKKYGGPRLKEEVKKYKEEEKKKKNKDKEKWEVSTSWPTTLKEGDQ